jgi:acyl-CoA synthetase (AMP-forming)/AMP-acid ligase II/acyl carrier protein
LPELLLATCRAHAAAAAIVAPARHDLTYAALAAQVDRIGNTLADAGFGRGSRIAIALPDGPEFVVTMLGVCAAATCAPLNGKLDEDTLRRLLAAMRIDALISPEGSDPPAVKAARRASVALIALKPSPGDTAGIVELIPQSPRGRRTFEPPRGDDIAMLMHTSGTTAAPKIVPWEQWRVVETACNRIELSRIDRSDRCLIALPLHSSAGIRRVLAGLLSGGSIICPGVLTADATLELMASAAPTQYFAPPASHIELLEAYERRVPRPRHFLKAIWSGTTDLPETIRARMEQAFGIPVIVGYGMTESGSIAQTPRPPERAPRGSVGRATNIDIAIADEVGRLLGPDEPGEIVVRGPEVFAGYEHNDEANRTAFRDDWFRTGDAGRIDCDGFVYLAGRLTDIINRGGVKIAPGEVEDALTQHPRVIEAAAFAIGHPTKGQDLAAAVVLRDAVSERDVHRFLRTRLAQFKIPTRIIEVAALPRTSSGKVDRVELARILGATATSRGEKPIGGEEIEVARIFCEVLQVPGVGRNDNFFDLGGDSLRGMRVLAAVDEALGVSVTLDLLFDHPTVSEFVAAFQERETARATPAGSPVAANSR